MVLLLSSALAGQDAFTIEEPRDNSRIAARFMTVVIRMMDPGIDTITISPAKKDKIMLLPAPKGKDVLCKIIPLNPELNEITVSASKAGSPVASKTITVYCPSDIAKNSGAAPPDFQQLPFHAKEREKLCSRCHMLTVRDKDMSPGNPDNSVCYPCHKKITDFKNVHGPAAQWECLICHDKDSVPVKYNVDKPEKDRCFSCHDSERTKWEAAKYMHGPTATGKCSICHNPHASQNPFWLKRRVGELCVSCHSDTLNGKQKHTFKIFSSMSNEHPTRGVRNPRNPAEQLSCTSCHNPHTSATPTLLAFEGGSMFAFCNQCHMK